MSNKKIIIVLSIILAIVLFIYATIYVINISKQSEQTQTTSQQNTPTTEDTKVVVPQTPTNDNTTTKDNTKDDNTNKIESNVSIEEQSSKDNVTNTTEPTNESKSDLIKLNSNNSQFSATLYENILNSTIDINRMELYVTDTPNEYHRAIKFSPESIKYSNIKINLDYLKLARAMGVAAQTGIKEDNDTVYRSNYNNSVRMIKSDGSIYTFDQLAEKWVNVNLYRLGVTGTITTDFIINKIGDSSKCTLKSVNSFTTKETEKDRLKFTNYLRDVGYNNRVRSFNLYIIPEANIHIADLQNLDGTNEVIFSLDGGNKFESTVDSNQLNVSAIRGLNYKEVIYADEYSHEELNDIRTALYDRRNEYELEKERIEMFNMIRDLDIDIEEYLEQQQHEKDNENNVSQ